MAERIVIIDTDRTVIVMDVAPVMEMIDAFTAYGQSALYANRDIPDALQTLSSCAKKSTYARSVH